MEGLAGGIGEVKQNGVYEQSRVPSWPIGLLGITLKWPTIRHAIIQVASLVYGDNIDAWVYMMISHIFCLAG